jgi:hypothetical protein
MSAARVVSDRWSLNMLDITAFLAARGILTVTINEVFVNNLKLNPRALVLLARNVAKSCS